MIHTDEDALICDLAETYHIYEYRKLPCKLAASFSCGLGESSRIKMKLSGQSVPTEHILLGAIVDRLSTLVWFKTKNGQNGVNRPKSVVESMLGFDKNENSEVMAFNTADDFRKKWNSLTERKGE